MTTYYVTTGQSMLLNSRCWRNRKIKGIFRFEDLYEFRTESDLIAEGAGGDHSVVQAMRAEVSSIFGRLMGEDDPAAADEIFSRDFNLDCWDLSRLHTLSAELATILLMQHESVFQRNDCLVLLHGSGRPGTVSAPTVDTLPEARIMAGIIRGLRARFQDYRLPEVQVSPASLSWWPGDRERFKASMQTLWERVIKQDPALKESAFILTGGYKSVAANLTARITAFVATQRENAPGVSMFYLFEDSDRYLRTHIRWSGDRLEIDNVPSGREHRE